MLGSKLVASPKGGGSGHGVKVLQLEKTGGSFVVIAADKNLSEVAAAIDNLIGRSPVTHNVPEIRNQVEGWSSRQASFHGFEVGVNVAKQQYVQ
jgi:hypothetical protein